MPYQRNWLVNQETRVRQVFYWKEISRSRLKINYTKPTNYELCLIDATNDGIKNKIKFNQKIGEEKRGEKLHDR